MALLSFRLQRGCVINHTDFTYLDGTTGGNKLLILLNNPSTGEPYLFAKTTSQKKSKPDAEGCHPKSNVFFMKSTSCGLDKDTWVQFHEIYEMEPAGILKDCLSKCLRIIHQLPEQKINEIKNCIKRSEDVSAYHKAMIVKIN